MSYTHHVSLGEGIHESARFYRTDWRHRIVATSGACAAAELDLHICLVFPASPVEFLTARWKLI